MGSLGFGPASPVPSLARAMALRVLQALLCMGVASQLARAAMLALRKGYGGLASILECWGRGRLQ